MKLIPKPKILGQQKGFTLVEVMTAAAIIIIMLTMTGPVIKQSFSSLATRRIKNQTTNLLRHRLGLMQGQVMRQGGPSQFLRSLHMSQNKFDPTITIDLNNPTNFTSAFGLNPVEQAIAGNTTVQITYNVEFFKYNASMSAQPIVTGTDSLSDLDFISLRAIAHKVEDGNVTYRVTEKSTIIAL